MTIENPEVFELPNGLRVVHSYIPGADVTHCGMFINVGTRDEQPDESGIAHLIEHMLFKGTEKRKSHHILSRLDAVGGELNAYTTKEETCVYATFTNPYLERAFDLIADVIFHSTFPDKEIDKERDVIVDEINSYKDSPSEQIYDDFEEQLFKGHSLSLPILGRPESIAKLTKEQLKAFIGKHYSTDQMVFSIVGGVQRKQVEQLAYKYFGQYDKTKSGKRKVSYTPTPIQRVTQDKPINQAHCTLGSIAYAYPHPNKVAMVLLSNMLGGSAMNAILNMTIRERYGIAYNIYTGYTAYADTGIFSVYIGTDAENMEKAISLTLKELLKLQNQALTSLKLNQGKQQLIGQLAIAQENRSGLMQAYGKSLLGQNKLELLPEIVQKINAITASQMMAIANEVLAEDKLSWLIYNPQQQ